MLTCSCGPIQKNSSPQKDEREPTQPAEICSSVKECDRLAEKAKRERPPVDAIPYLETSCSLSRDRCWVLVEELRREGRFEELRLLVTKWCQRDDDGSYCEMAGRAYHELEPRSPPKIREMFEIGCAKNDAPSCRLLAAVIEIKIVSGTDAEVFSFYEKACELGAGGSAMILECTLSLLGLFRMYGEALVCIKKTVKNANT